MKLTSNQRIGIGIVLVLIAMIATCTAIRQSGPAVISPTPAPADTVIVNPKATAAKPPKTAKPPKPAKPAPPPRQHLDETF